MRLLARFPTTDWCWAEGQWNLNAAEPGWSGLTRLLTQPMLPGERLGTVSGGSVLDIVIGQINIPNGGPFGDPANPIPVWQATWTATEFTPRVVHLATETQRFRVYTSRGTSQTTSRLDLLTEGATAIRVVPAPAPALVLAAAALAAPRRCRSRS